MPSSDGSELYPLEARARWRRERPWRAATAEEQALLERRQGMVDAWYAHFWPVEPVINADEISAIWRGEPYCFLCGKPASSFPEYWEHPTPRPDGGTGTEADYVRREEGTYNPDTNRFACDKCYIRIGTPSGPNGWRAP